MQGRAGVRWDLTVLIGAAVLALVAAPAMASPRVGQGLPVTLEPGEQVTLFAREDGDFGVVRVVPLTEEPETAPAPRDVDQEYMLARPSERTIRFGAPEGTVRFSYWNSAAEGARLKLENNSGRTLIYSAEIEIAGRPGFQATTICSVAQGTAAYELWPDDITAIRITGFYARPAGSGQVCGYPERDQLTSPPPSIESPPASQSGGGK